MPGLGPWLNGFVYDLVYFVAALGLSVSYSNSSNLAAGRSSGQIWEDGPPKPVLGNWESDETGLTVGVSRASAHPSSLSLVAGLYISNPGVVTKALRILLVLVQDILPEVCQSSHGLNGGCPCLHASVIVFPYLDFPTGLRCVWASSSPLCQEMRCTCACIEDIARAGAALCRFLRPGRFVCPVAEPCARTGEAH